VKWIARNDELSCDRVLQVASTRAYHPARLLAMSHVLDDNIPPEKRCGRQKPGETQDIEFLKEILANDADVCRRGKVVEEFDEVARAMTRTMPLPGTRTVSFAMTGTNFFLQTFEGWSERARGERDQLLADIQSAVNVPCCSLNCILKGLLQRRRRDAVDARRRIGSSRGILVRAARGDSISPLRFYLHMLVLYVYISYPVVCYAGLRLSMS
jgi:hypothetical protein